jgi:hypothetical protein
MPPHSSHLFQPLDIALFKPLKRAYGKQVENMMRILLTRVSKEDFIPAFKNAFFQVFGQKNIRSGFRGAELVPHDPKQVIAKFDVKLRPPTPDIESEFAGIVGIANITQSYKSPIAIYFFKKSDC